MKKGLCVLDCMKEIEAAAEGACQEVRHIRSFAVGKHTRQGDVYLVRVKDDAPHGAPIGTRQVAVGSTVGARHFAEGAGVSVYANKGFRDFPEFAVGPVVVADKEWTLTHPEHAHCRVPAGTYQVIYQREGQRRVAD